MTWSLSVEVVFSLVFPFVIVLLRRLSGRGLAVTAAVTLALMALLPLVVTLAGVNSYSNLYYWLFFVFPPYRFGEFLLGVVLARAMTAFTAHAGIPVMRPFVAGLRPAARCCVP